MEHPWTQDIADVLAGRKRWTVITADCLAVLPTIPAGSVDAVVTDPPYGIKWSGHGASTREWTGFANDTGEMDIRSILSMSCAVLAFGANCYPSQLPHRGRWLCWDKRTIDGACDTMLGSPFELAWSNKTSGYDRIVRVLHGGVVNADGGRRCHPTQKPTAVMMDAIAWLGTPEDAVVVDPFSGSGSTGVAAMKMNRRFIGIEISEQYATIARRRIAEAANHLFAGSV